jgi:hypothetical protein
MSAPCPGCGGPAAPPPDVARAGDRDVAQRGGGLVHVSVADGSVHRLSQAGCHRAPVASVVPRIVHRAVPDGADHLVLVGGAANAENLDLVERVPVR